MLCLSMAVDTNLAYLSLSFLLVCFLLLIFPYIILRPCPVKVPIKGRHVFITGGSYGIGFALAHCAAMEGAHVSILARSLPKLQEAKEIIQRDTGHEVGVYVADARDFEAVRRAVEHAGPIDVLVVNHGFYKAQELEKQELEEVRTILEVNLMGTFNVVKAALPSMKSRKDRRPVSIALMSSQACLVGVYGYAAYSTTKFGLRGLAESLQQEVIGDNIYVSVICPPDTPTPGLEKDKKTIPRFTTMITSSSPSMEVDEVAKQALCGIRSGNFIIPCNFKGLLLSISTSATAFSPQKSFARVLIEVILASIARCVAFWYQRSWYKMIEKFHAQQM